MHALRTWALIADGSRAFILENSGRDNDWTKLDGNHIGKDRSGDHTAISQGEEKPFDREGAAVAVLTLHSNPDHASQTHFASGLVHVLQTALENDAFQHLIIAAPPTMLGELRPLLSEKLKSHITEEVPHDLTKTPVHEISKHLKPVQLV